VGFVPGYAEIGIWGAVILTVLRLIQGIGVGGELGGAVCRSAPSPQPSPREGPAPLGERARACRWAHLRCARGEPAPDPIRG